MSSPLVILVLVHGHFGWGETEKRENQMKDYFYGVQRFLATEYGTRPDFRLVMVAPTVPRAESVEARGARLKEAIATIPHGRSPGTRVHILAHRMGGLDARWVIVQEGMADKIASLTTIATPHRGTTLGDLAYDELPIILPAGEFLQRLDKTRRWIWRRLPFTRAASSDQLEFYHQLLQGFDSTEDQLGKALYALSLAGAAEFNRRYAQAERAVRERTKNRVAYFADGGVMRPSQTPLLKPSHHIIALFGREEEREEGNDGAVSVWSSRYPWDDAGRDYVKTVPFDHFMQINWRIPDRRPSEQMSDDLKTVYREIMEAIIRVQRAQ